MSFRPSSSSSRGALHRGLACLVCRKRKIRCDALKPSCSPCQKLIANWRPASGTPRPACIYDATSPNPPFLPFNPSVDTPSEANESLSQANNPATHPFPSPSSSPTPSTQQSLKQEALAPISSSSGLEASYKKGSSVNFRKRGLSQRPSSEHRGEKQASASASFSLSRSRSQSQTGSAGGRSETATSALFSSYDSGKEHNPFRTYSKLPRRASSPSLRSLSQGGDAQGQAPFTGTRTPFLFTSDFSKRPPKSILDRLTDLFFKYCSISSIIRRDVYNPEKAISGSTIDQALLRAILAIACLYSDSLEEVHESFWRAEGGEPESIVVLDANGVAQAHSSASRRLIDLLRSDDGQMEAVLPISLLLVSYGMQSKSSQGDLQVQFEICWSSIAIKRLAFYKLPSPSSTSISSTSSTLLQERISVFWTFYILDRQYQARMAIPPLLAEQDISTAIPSTNDGISSSSRLQSSMSLNSSVFVTTETRKLSWVLYIRVVRFFSLCLSRRLRRGEDDSFNASFDAEVAELENQTALLSSRVRGEVPKPITHLSAIQLLLHASKLIYLETDDEKSLDSPKVEYLEASRSVAQSAKASIPSSLKYRDFFEVNSFWIAGKSLIRYLASNVELTVASQDEILEDLKSILACLWKHSTRGKLLARSLIALYKTINSPTGFLSTPSFWPPEARLPRSYSGSQVTTLLELSRWVEDSELEFLNR